MSNGGRPRKLTPDDAKGSAPVNGFFKPLPLGFVWKPSQAGEKRARDSDYDSDGTGGESEEEVVLPGGRKRVIHDDDNDDDDDDDDDDEDEDDEDDEAEKPRDGFVAGQPYPMLVPNKRRQSGGKGRSRKQDAMAMDGELIEAPDESGRSHARKLLKKQSKSHHSLNSNRPAKFGAIRLCMKKQRENASEGDQTLVIKTIDGHTVLYCTVCLIHVNPKGSAFKKHMEGKTGHMQRVAELPKKKQDENKMRTAMKEYLFKHPDLRGVGVTMDTHTFRLEALAALFDAGIPMSKIDDLRPFLEKWTKQSLTGRQHLGMYVEALAAAELKDILELVKECQAVSVIFDGTTRVDEVLAVVFRFVKDDFSIVQKLVSLAKYKDVKNHEKLAFAVLAVLAAHGIQYATGVVGWQRDRAAVNGAAMTYLTESYGGLDMKCLSHTITHVGEHMETELLDTQTVRDLVVAPIRRGDVSGMSFAFVVANSPG
jgi:hypothetical protein